MQLALWTYEGPPHVGAMRIATSMRGVHYVLHAPQGDTYADLLFTMIDRRDRRPPVTYTTFQARDLGGDTAELVKRAARDAIARYSPDLLLVGESCTAELLQDQPGSLVDGMNTGVKVVPLELPAYSKKENWGASETFYRVVRAVLGDRPRVDRASRVMGERRSCNILGPTALGFRNRDDTREIRSLLAELGIDVRVVAPWDATVESLSTLPDADFNVVLYPETAEATARWLEKQFGMPMTTVVPIGVRATRAFIEEVGSLAGMDVSAYLASERTGGGIASSRSLLPWYSRSVDATYLTGKRVFVFGDASHAIAAARVARDELGFTVVGIGTYSREYARAIRAVAADFGVEALIADDHLEVEAAINALAPELVLGTQMERHIAKRLGIACAVISAPFHVQDVPARHSPQMGFEGANVLFDTWVHPLMMGLEAHLLGMFREDFEFGADAAPSHLGAHDPAPVPASLAGVAGASDDSPAAVAATAGASPAGVQPAPVSAVTTLEWSASAEEELKKIPFFVRGKARRNTERFALERGTGQITVDTLYEAKAHYGR